MNPPWHAEVQLTATEVASLARRAFDLPCNEIQRLGEGWDFFTYLVDNTWVIRLPKRQQCSDVLLREQALLEVLNRSDLPLPVPYLERMSGPVGRFPWHFGAYRVLAGVPLAGVKTEPPSQEIFASVGRFLTSLHSIETQTAWQDPWADGSDDDWRRREYAASLKAYPQAFARRMDEYLRLEEPAKPDVPMVLAHADLNAEHILVDPDSFAVTGIIDWADACTSLRSVDYVGLCFEGGVNAVQQAFNATGQKVESDELLWILHQSVAMGVGHIYYGWSTNCDAMVGASLGKIQQNLLELGL